jgi:ribosomal-protein-alanine N-acetyltransferase
VILETPRLILRPFREEDLDLLAPLMANPDFMRFSLGVYSREQTAAFLDKVINWQRFGLPTQFAVIHGADNRLIGYCGFLHQQVDATDEIEIAYRLDPDYWSRGLATEAATAVRDHAFRNLKLTRVISLIHPDNLPSRRVAEKNGMTVKKNCLSWIPHACLCDQSRAVAEEPCRLRNSRASARYAFAPAPFGSYSRMDLPKLGASLRRMLRGITVS